MNAAAPIIETTTGRVQGATGGRVSAFLGIPYGGPVSGAGRFAPPTAAAPWAGVRAATVFGPGAPQGDPRSDLSPEAFAVFRLLYPGSGSPLEGRASAEDALVLNVWTPATDGAKPVMVWLHGGGFTSGTGAEGWFQGDRLAERDVVVVTVNHRLGLLGFMPPAAIGAEPTGAESAGASGLAGMLDIVLALQWVRDNIAAFGGDPANVTIFGQSGGGMKVSTLMGMPRAAGLFHKVAVQSGSTLRAIDADASAATAARLAELAEAAGVDDLRTAPVEAIIGLQSALLRTGGGALALGPVLGADLPAHPFDPAAPASADRIPMLIGSATHESTLFLAFDPTFHHMTAADLPARFAGLFGDRGPALLEAYNEVEDTPHLVLARAMTDATFLGPIREMRARKAQQHAPVFSYLLDYRTEVLNGLLGAHHSADLALIFDNADRSPVTGSRPERFAVADAMAGAWAAFAHTGDPNGAERPAGAGETWLPFGTGDGQAEASFVFDAQPRMQQADAAAPALGLLSFP